MNLDDTRVRVPLTAAAGAFLYLAPSISAGVPFVRPWLGVRDRTRSGQGVVLTFDDGPHPVGTVQTLEWLAGVGASAVFFLVGEQVERRPTLAAEIVAAGHQIGVHCQRHRSLLRLAPWQVRDDLVRAEAAIADATGVEPRLYRPPYGVLNAAALLHARGRGWETVLWARDGHDWQADATPHSIVERLTRNLHDGDVLLLHDADYYSSPGSHWRTLAALPPLLDELARSGLEPTKLD